MPSKAKQADRKAGKQPKNQEDDEVSVTAGSFTDLAKSMVMGSVIAENGKNFPYLVQDGIAIIKGEKKVEQNKEEKPKEEAKEEKEENEQESKEGEDKENIANKAVSDFVVENDVCGLFNKISSRLHWSNPLGLATPASGEDSVKAWKALKGLDLDFGPRAKRKGNPGMERISANLYNNFAQYVHILLLLMVVRAFLFRSFFACLPWLIGYQFLSLFLPLDKLPQAPQLPLDKVPVEIRVAITLVLNGLVQLFFVYELLWKTYFFEKIPLVGLIVYHAYAVRPAEA